MNRPCILLSINLKAIQKLLVLFLAFLSVVLKAQDSANISHTLYFIGDCGEPIIAGSVIGSVLNREVKQSGPNTTVIYLGDNVYPAGLPGEEHLGRKYGEKILQTQVDWIKDTPARGIFIPGNHDWQHWNRNGWQYVLNQQAWFDSLKLANIQFLPRGGCPGPVELPVNDHTILVIIDTQWLLHAYDKPEESSDCDYKTTGEFMSALNDVLDRHAGKRVILTAHHPVVTYGDHGGFFTWKDHLFPLTDLHRHLYIPMPIVGSLYPLYRGVFGHPQDVKHPLYKAFSEVMQKMLRQHPHTVYVAGHEHALQYIVRDSSHYIVSGAGVKVTPVRRGRYAQYARGVKGFVKMTLQPGGIAHLDIWQVDEEFPDGRIVYQGKIPAPKPLAAVLEPIPDFSNKTVRVKASSQNSAAPAGKRFCGRNYRKVWEQEIDVPVFDLSTEQGGLTIIKKAGGQQALSLRLKDKRGREYILRSVEKYPKNAVPESLRKTFAQELVQNQISASHPYAAVVIPPLARAVGIYHTRPKLVFIPDDPRLGNYRKTFANTLALFEEHPGSHWSDEVLGQPVDILNTGKVFERLNEDHANRVDQLFVLRSRLFDLWIGDWDRHEDQWHWACFTINKEKLYRPVPRDRDQALFIDKGIFPKVRSRTWALPKFEGFDNDINWPARLTFNARTFDRRFLTEPSLDDWIETARDLQTRLTDAVIEEAIRLWPKEIFDLHGAEIISALKARRNNLLKTALQYYELLAREVDVVGSDKAETFTVLRHPDGNVRVNVNKINNDGTPGNQLYTRLFKHHETKEIRLYGRGSEDKFLVEGQADKSILVRIIGGDGRDSVTDLSEVHALRHKTIFYDARVGNRLMTKGETADRRSRDPQVNRYDRKSFTYDLLAPLLYGNFNPDDGLFFGGGLYYHKEGFRKQPFKYRHIVLARTAPLTRSYNFTYRGDFTDVFFKWDVAINADIKSPNYVNNFFGMGNETVFDQKIKDKPGYRVDDPIEYYRFRFKEFRIEPHLSRAVGHSSRFKIGPAFQRIEVEAPDDVDRYIHREYVPSLPYDPYNKYNTYAGIAYGFTTDHRNDKRFTTNGLLFRIEGRTMQGLTRYAHDFTAVEGLLAVYHSFRLPARLVFAARAGGGLNRGNFEFYQAQVLSGTTELRGFRKTRFYGDRKFFTNLEARFKLFEVKTYYFPASFGILGFHDLGRVWYKDNNGIDPSAGGASARWHKGWGGGIWVTPFNLTVLSLEAGHSSEGTLAYVRFGFFF